MKADQNFNIEEGNGLGQCTAEQNKPSVNTQEYYCFLELCLPIQLPLVPRNHNSDVSHLIMLNVILVQVYIISSSKNDLDYKTARQYTPKIELQAVMHDSC